MSLGLGRAPADEGQSERPWLVLLVELFGRLHSSECRERQVELRHLDCKANLGLRHQVGSERLPDLLFEPGECSERVSGNLPLEVQHLAALEHVLRQLRRSPAADELEAADSVGLTHRCSLVAVDLGEHFDGGR